jgi:hypothetical protein
MNDLGLLMLDPRIVEILVEDVLASRFELMLAFCIRLCKVVATSGCLRFRRDQLDLLCDDTCRTVGYLWLFLHICL